MTPSSHARRAAALIASLLVAGCATPPWIRPVTHLGRQTCSPMPDLAAAHPVALGGATIVDLRGHGPCLRTAEGTGTTYAVFRLPDVRAPYLVTVTSGLLRGRALLPPRLVILDGQGNEVRELSADDFLSRGSSLSAAIQTHPGEYFVVVIADPASVGQHVSYIADAPMTFGIKRQFTTSYNGRITVSAQAIPKAD